MSKYVVTTTPTVNNDRTAAAIAHLETVCFGVETRVRKKDIAPKTKPKIGNGKQITKSCESKPGALFIAPASHSKPANGTPTTAQTTERMVIALLMMRGATA